MWREETHVEAGRERYRRSFAIAERLLGNRFGFTAPAGGFFLWLDVGDGEAAAKRLWAEAGLRVLPGAYMARPDAEGRNPGTPYIRVALVHEPEVVEEGLTR
ncbi:MAG: aspartate aminotransferase, partial [Dongiales bacterium]